MMRLVVETCCCGQPFDEMALNVVGHVEDVKSMVMVLHVTLCSSDDAHGG